MLVGRLQAGSGVHHIAVGGVIEEAIAAKIADHGDNQILLVHPAHKIKIFIARQKIAKLAIEVGLLNQIFQHRKATSKTAAKTTAGIVASAAIADLQTILTKGAEDIFHALLVIVGQRE